MSCNHTIILSMYNFSSNSRPREQKHKAAHHHTEPEHRIKVRTRDRKHIEGHERRGHTFQIVDREKSSFWCLIPQKRSQPNQHTDESESGIIHTRTSVVIRARARKASIAASCCGTGSMRATRVGVTRVGSRRSGAVVSWIYPTNTTCLAGQLSLMLLQLDTRKEIEPE